jgi:hypothetical protein
MYDCQIDIWALEAALALAFPSRKSLSCTSTHEITDYQIFHVLRGICLFVPTKNAEIFCPAIDSDVRVAITLKMADKKVG